MKQSEFDVIVVGAGAAGTICAGVAARRGLRVLLCEQGVKPLHKVRITGKGRCNVTNNCTTDAMMSQVRRNPRFLHSALDALSPVDTMEFFEKLGVPLKTERGGRVFPVSDLAGDIAQALLNWAVDGGAKLVRETACRSLVLENGVLEGIVCKNGKRYTANKVVLATGGLSYPKTGSNGSGYILARQVGHNIVSTRPSLIPMQTAESWCGEISGLSLRNVTLNLWQEGKKKPIYSELGEMLFTHFGVSGPLVLTASSYMKECSGYKITIDLKPGLSMQQLDARLLRDFSGQVNRDFKNTLGELLPQSLIPVMVELSGIDGETKIHQITKIQRTAFCELIKALPLTPVAFRPIDEAIITAGGVDIKQVNPKTMESKLCAGLFFAGEMLDLDATTGGYNLQIAFSTGWLAGQNV